MAAINTYLHFSGNCKEVFDFYRSVFGGDFSMVMYYKDAPSADPNHQFDPNHLMHISLPIGRGTSVMGSDRPAMYGEAVHGNAYHISVDADSLDEAKHIFNGLSAGGQVMMPFEKAFWGAHFGMLVDKYGIQWMVSFEEPKA